MSAVGLPENESARLLGLLRRLPERPLQAGHVRAFVRDLTDWILGERAFARRREARAARLEALADVLDREFGRGSLRQFLIDLRRPESLVRLLAETGIPVEASLLGEISRRMVARTLSIDVGSTDLAALFALAQLAPQDQRLVDAVSERVWNLFGPLFEPHGSEIRTAFELVLRRAVAAGLARNFLRLGTREQYRDSPFFALEPLARALLEQPLDPGLRAEFERGVETCRRELEAIHARTELLGVSTELLFRIEQAQALLERLDQLACMLAGEDFGRGFLRVVLSEAGAERSLSALLNSKLKRLSRRVVEHASHAGEHYVVRTGKEYAAMGLAACYGGALTAVTALGKLALSATSLAPGLLGLVHSLNYSASFVTMQFAGFTLASRQPSVTAAALADSLQISDGSEKEVDLIAGITRAQTVSTAGNVLVALPTAMLLDALIRFFAARTLLDAEQSQHAIEILVPQHPQNVLFAALTGVLLWIASLVGGWASNWSALHSLPLALAESSPLRRTFGTSGASRIGRIAERYVGGISGYVALGFMMGFVPVIAQFVGLPIWTPHVTLSSASLGYAISSNLWAGTFEPAPVLWAFLGVLMIGFLNFTVSFALALRLALRAMDVGRRERLSLLRSLGRALVQDPLRFILPTKSSLKSN